jgi:MoaA/NifB/PqqE/SkfB family radical SAM enzyme
MIYALSHRKFREDPYYYSLHWAVTNNCNYRCDYCGVHKKEKYYDFHNIIEFVNFIGTLNRVDTVLFGGEPLIHPNILQIVGQLETNIRICTNLSKNIGFFRELIKINSDLTIVASLHYEKQELIDFYEKISFLCDYSKFVKVKVMWDSRYKEDIKSAYEFLLSTEDNFQNLKIYLDMVYHDLCEFNDDDLLFFDRAQNDDRFYVRTDRQEKYTSYNEIRRAFNGFPNFYGWKCFCGPKGLFIDSDGSVYYCQTKRNKNKPLFNLNTDDFTKYLTIFEKPIKCNENDFCCEVVVPRRRIK